MKAFFTEKKNREEKGGNYLVKENITMAEPVTQSRRQTGIVKIGLELWTQNSHFWQSNLRATWEPLVPFHSTLQGHHHI